MSCGILVRSIVRMHDHYVYQVAHTTRCMRVQKTRLVGGPGLAVQKRLLAVWMPVVQGALRAVVQGGCWCLVVVLQLQHCAGWMAGSS